MGFFNDLISGIGKEVQDRMAVIEKLRFCSDDELKEYLKHGTSVEREAARVILQSRA